MIFRRFHLNAKEVIDDSLKEKYQLFLSNMITLPMGSEFVGVAKKGHVTERLTTIDITDKYRRRLLLEEIYNFKLYLRGQQAQQLVSYFYGLSLQDDVQQMIADKSWTEKIMGLKMVSSFTITECIVELNDLIHCNNRELALHAIQARIGIDQNLSVLELLKYQLTDWEKHKIHQTATSIGVSADYLISPVCETKEVKDWIKVS